MGPRPSFHDSTGLVISTDQPAAALSYAAGLELLLSSSPDATRALRHATTVDPHFGLAWMALAVATCTEGLATEGNRCADRAGANLAGSTRRERQHIEVITMLLAGDLRRAAVLGREHLREYPTDLLVAHALASWSAA
ncbi:MAG: hypothetical protein ABI706_14000 [Ilumatobacteraceae bacterium]